MRRVLNVAEKPSVANAIATILGGSPRKRGGASKFNPVFDFNYTWRGTGRSFVVTSVTGHMMEVDFPAQYRNWSARDPIALFSAPLVRGVKEDAANIAKQLQTEARGADTLLLWLDCDREGENICYEVIEVCLQANPRLDVWRARFASIVPREIVQAANNPVRPNQLDSEAVDARIELDLRTGAVWTRFLSLRYKNNYAGLEDTISYGACQFPTLGFVVHRFNQIESFVPEPFWKLVLEMEKNGKTAAFNWERVRLFDQSVVTALYEQCIKGKVATVTHVATKPKLKYRPFPLTTVKLQQLGTGSLRMSGEEIMKHAEALYQRGLISYPRTETDAFAPGTPFADLIREQHNDPQFGAYAQSLRFREPKKGKNSDQAHTAIHPTKSGAQLNGAERRVYELIARHFLACCSDDAKGSETVVKLELGGEEFSLSGLVIHELNYLEVYPYDKWADKDIPNFVQGESIKPKSLAIEAGVTSAPELLTERDLITLMDKHGIGTDATISAHIQKILERSYVTKQGQHFSPTKLGLTLVNGFDRMGFEFSQPTLRAQTERDMLAISAGQITKAEALARNVASYRRLYELQQQQVAVLDSEFAKTFDARRVRYSRRTPAFSKCGKCGNVMDLVADGDAQSLLCGTCNDTYVLEPKFPVVVSALNHECPICSFQVVEVKSTFPITVCPSCKKNPPAQFFSPEARTDCRDCTNGACSLAKGSSNRPVRICPVCRKHSMVLRNNKKTGGVFLSCNQYPACSGVINLPSCQSATVSADKCDSCSAKFGVPIQQLQFSFSGSGQALGGPLAASYCVAGCSTHYMNPMLAQANPGAKDLFVSGGPAAAAAAAPAPAASGPKAARTQPNLQGSYQRMSNAFAGNENAALMCKCGIAAKQLTVNKDGPNNGRPFHTCGNRDRTCDFFKWADEPDGSSGPSYRSSSSTAASSFSSSSVQCKCGVAARELTSKKEGNAGRRFFNCGTPKQCGFFVWADEAGKAAFSGAAVKATVSGSCFLCGDTGHFANKCPTKGGPPPSRSSAPAAKAAKKRGRPAKKQ